MYSAMKSCGKGKLNSIGVAAKHIADKYANGALNNTPAVEEIEGIQCDVMRSIYMVAYSGCEIKDLIKLGLTNDIVKSGKIDEAIERVQYAKTDKTRIRKSNSKLTRARELDEDVYTECAAFVITAYNTMADTYSDFQEEILKNLGTREAVVLGSVADAFYNISKDIIRIPTTYCIHSAFIYYKVYKDFGANAVKNLYENQSVRAKAPVVEEGETFREFATKLFGEDSIDAVMEYFKYNYAKLSDVDDDIIGSYAIILENLTKAVMKKLDSLGIIDESYDAKENKDPDLFWLYGLFKSFKNEIGKYGFMANIWDVNEMASFLVTIGISLNSNRLSVTTDEIFGYEYLKYLNGHSKMEKDSAEYHTLKKFVSLAYTQFFGLMNDFKEYSIAERVLYLKNKNSKLEESLARQTKNLEREQEKLKEIRIKLREKSKEAKQIESNLKTEKNKSSKLQKTADLGVSVDDFESMQRSMQTLEENIDKLRDENNDLSRQLSRKDKDIQEIGDKLMESESKYRELEEKYNRTTDLTSKMQAHRVFNEIPIECFINIIKDKHIVLVGGDMMYTKLNSYGLNNIRMYKAGCKELEFNDISDTDLVVIATAFVDHSSTEKVVRLSRTHNIPLMKFNNKNADMLIYSIFEEMFKNK